MKIIPVLTEKSLNLAKDGHYTFWTGISLGKEEIRKLIEKLHGVHVTGIRTINYKAGIKKNSRGRKVSFSARKKVMVTLKKDERIDAFEVKKGKAKK